MRRTNPLNDPPILAGRRPSIGRSLSDASGLPRFAVLGATEANFGHPHEPRSRSSHCAPPAQTHACTDFTPAPRAVVDRCALNDRASRRRNRDPSLAARRARCGMRAAVGELRRWRGDPWEGRLRPPAGGACPTASWSTAPSPPGYEPRSAAAAWRIGGATTPGVDRRCVGAVRRIDADRGRDSTRSRATRSISSSAGTATLCCSICPRRPCAARRRARVLSPVLSARRRGEPDPDVRLRRPERTRSRAGTAPASHARRLRAPPIPEEVSTDGRPQAQDLRRRPVSTACASNWLLDAPARSLCPNCAAR